MKSKEKKGKIIIISGPSGAGKTTIIHHIIHQIPYIEQCITYTTRAKRPEERNGVDHYFVDESTFSQLIRDGKLAEWAIINGYRYGTPKDGINTIVESGKHAIIDIDIKGANAIKSIYPAALSIFIKPPSINVLKERLEIRGERDRLEERLKRAEIEMEQAPLYDYVVVNDTLDNAVSMVARIIKNAIDA
ncbi:MAG: guanylate kinase [bacterium]